LDKKEEQPKNLLPFIGHPRKNMPKVLPFELQNHLQLIELTGRCIREDEAGYIETKQPALLTRLNISPENWLTLSKGFERFFHEPIGDIDVLADYCQHQGFKRRQNLSCGEKLLA
jgi:hypothetical protein